MLFGLAAGSAGLHSKNSVTGVARRVWHLRFIDNANGGIALAQLTADVCCELWLSRRDGLVRRGVLKNWMARSDGDRIRPPSLGRIAQSQSSSRNDVPRRLENRDIEEISGTSALTSWGKKFRTWQLTAGNHLYPFSIHVIDIAAPQYSFTLPTGALNFAKKVLKVSASRATVSMAL